MMKRIVVPLDGSSLAEHALAVAATLARSSGGTLILVQALTLPAAVESPLVPQVIPFDLEDQMRRSQAYLRRQVGLPVLSGLPIETAVLTEPPALSILNAAAEYRADMIVMTSHGRTGFSRWIFGSVAEHVARQAHVPVRPAPAGTPVLARGSGADRSWQGSRAGESRPPSTRPCTAGWLTAC